MTREPIEVTRQDRIFCLKASSDYHSEVCEECKFYPNCDHMTQDDMAELTIKDLETLEQEPCGDTISSEMTIDTLHDKAPDQEGVDDLIAIIKEIPSVTQKSETVTEFADRCRECGARYGKLLRKWIPVSERLPEFRKEVLTCTDGGFIEIQSLEDSYDGYWENQNGDWTDLEEIIAWMPLLEPYKESEEQE